MPLKAPAGKAIPVIAPPSRYFQESFLSDTYRPLSRDRLRDRGKRCRLQAIIII